MISDDDDEEIGGLFEGGQWEWDDHNNELVFLRNLCIKSEIEMHIPKAVVGPIEFKDDVDLIEQQRFKKRFQRKAAEDDVVTLQDVKDVVLFMAPLSILTVSLIDMLHIPAAERFLRALILCLQYYIQIADEMSQRSLELLVKVRTPSSIETETKFRENLQDLRSLVAKEYCSLILGAAEYRKYHHMGADKKRRSLSKKDAIFFETFLRIAIQIVWIALGRKSLHKIEIEIHRMFKTSIFNIVEHKVNTNFDARMSPDERFVLYGHCLRQDTKINSRSPLMNEISCGRNIDFQLLGLGVIGYPCLNGRLHLMESALVTPESSLKKFKMTLGIIGMPRSKFDTMLKQLPAGQSTSSASFKSATSRSASKSSRGGVWKSATSVPGPIYPDLIMPDKSTESFPEEFPSTPFANVPSCKSCNESQRCRWLARLGVGHNKYRTRPSVQLPPEVKSKTSKSTTFNP